MIVIYRPLNAIIEYHTIPEQEESSSSQAPEAWITIFVHGIMSIQPHLTLHNLMRFVRDDVQNTIYSKTVEYMRQNPYFYLNQAMQEFGLKKIDPQDLQPGNASSGVAYCYDYITQLCPQSTQNHYYTFGWSGLLSPKSRYTEAIRLLKELTVELQTNFWSKNIFPKIRLIGYSHGGNVCLNFAAARNNVIPDSPIEIDELILIGTPIQTETDYLVADPVFKKVYHIFSRADRIQRIDFFSFNRIFSQRYFKNTNRFKIPKKLVQIEIKITRKSKSARKGIKKTAEYTNFYNKGIISGKSRLLRDISPGHLEFWFFGWSPRHYRKSFPLSPLPTFLLMPYIIYCINLVGDKIKSSSPVIVDIRPEFDTMLIKQRKKNNFTGVFPFISQKDLNHLSKISYMVAIDSSFEDEYDKHVRDAFNQAMEYYKIYDYKKSRTGSYKRNRRLRKRNLTPN